VMNFSTALRDGTLTVIRGVFTRTAKLAERDPPPR